MVLDPNESHIHIGALSMLMVGEYEPAVSFLLFQSIVRLLSTKQEYQPLWTGFMMISFPALARFIDNLVTTEEEK